MRRKCKRAPCNRLQKAYEEDVLIPFPGPVKDRPKPPRTQWSKCLEERKIHQEIVAKKAIESLRESKARYQRFNALAGHIAVRPFPRLEDEDLIDLDDLPSKAKVKKNAVASDWYQRKMQFLPLTTKNGIAAKVKKLKSQQITTDFQVVSHVKRCQQTKLQERIEHAIEKRGLTESKAICAQREVSELRRKIIGESNHYHVICRRMEEKDRQLSALIVQNRSLISTTDKKMQLLYHFEQDFRENKTALLSRLRVLKRSLKNLVKQDFPPKYTQGYPPKVKVCPVKNEVSCRCTRPREMSLKGPDTELIIMNHTKLPERRCPKSTVERDAPPQTSETPPNQFWHLKECAKLRDYELDLKFNVIRKEAMSKAFVKQQKERIEDFSASAEAEYFTPIRKAIRRKIQPRLKFWRRQAILMRAFKPDAMWCRGVLKKHSKYIEHAYKYAMRSLQRVGVMGLTAMERGRIAQRLATAQAIAQSGPVRNKPEILPLLLLHLDEILLGHIRAMKVRKPELL